MAHQQHLSKLQRQIVSACTPSFSGPDVGLYLEIAATVNEKKLNAPREAALTIVNRINSSSPDVARLALMLLDICVKNCGYPFHLQISSREFLNELVKRFPERPPPRKSERMMAILEQIELWYVTICRSSRHKEDLGFIRDMHSLLYRKGYSFPTPKDEDISVLRQVDTVQTADEMEKEDRLAQEAKLQELIRRGTPRDLEEANRLMKILAGYDQRLRTDYRAKAAEEVAKVQEKAKLLEEMIQLKLSGDQSDTGDVYEELANALVSAHIKIKKMCAQESDDTEAVEKLVAISDSIDRTIQRFRLVKKGELSSVADIRPGTLGTSGPGVSKDANDDLLLIDLDGPSTSSPQQEDVSSPNPSTAASSDLVGVAAEPPASATGASLMDDLIGLSIGDSSASASLGAISLPLGKTIGSAGVQLSNLQMLSGPSSATSKSVERPSSQELLSGLAGGPTPGANSGNGSTKPLVGLYPAKSADPFAGLTRDLTPTHTGSQNGANSPNLIDVPATSKIGPLSTAVSPPDDDDQWEFASSLPVSAKKTSLQVSKPADGLSITWNIERMDDDSIQIQSEVSSRLDSPVDQVVVEVATSKAYKLELKPQTATALKSRTDLIHQHLLISNVGAGQGRSVQMRWRARYLVEGQTDESRLMGVVAGLGVD